MKPAITITTTGEGTLTIDDQTITINTGNPDSTRSLLTSIAKNRHTGPLTLTIDGHTTTINPDTDTEDQPAAGQPVDEDQPVDETTPQHRQQEQLHHDDAAVEITPPPETMTPAAPHMGSPQPPRHDTHTIDIDDLFHHASLGAGMNRSHGTSPTQLPDRIITLANLKGGTGKTPLAVVLAQALAQLAGHDDIAVIELNPRGTLAARAPSHTDLTITDLAAAARRDGFATRPRDLDPYLSWQPEGWATIVCPPSIVNDINSLITPITSDDLDRIITALHSRFHILILDTGNNDLDAAWQHAITISDRIIIPVQWDPDTLTLTQNMVSDMDHLGHTGLKNRVLWVGTHAPIDRPNHAMKKSFSTALVDAGWTVHNIPADRHIAADATITWTKLARRTRKAATTLAKATL